MIFMQYYAGCLSQAAYLVADERTRRAVLVDPLRDIEQYLTDARARDIEIVGVVLTHFHADFVAGHLEVAAATGAWVGLGEHATPEFPARLLADGERIDLGDGGVALEVLATPGHTPESISLLVFENGADPVPRAVLTGDALFVGDVGRVDLQASFGADPEQLAIAQHGTIQHKLMGLPDSVEVWPAHGAGSACGRSIGLERSSTIGAERAGNPACRPMDVAEFAQYLADGQSVPPAYFDTDAGINRRSHALFTADAAKRHLTLDELDAHLRAGGAVLDARDKEEFVLGHLPGSLGVPLVGRFAETVGMFHDVDRPLVAIYSEPGVETELVSRLGRIGVDGVVGVVGGPEIGALAAAGRLVPTPRVTAAELDEELRSEDPPYVIDVRSVSEHALGAVPTAVNIPLPQLARRVAEVPRGRRIVVHCQGGWRSSVAASWLLAAGFDVADLQYGYEGWLRYQATVAPAA